MTGGGVTGVESERFPKNTEFLVRWINQLINKSNVKCSFFRAQRRIKIWKPFIL